MSEPLNFQSIIMKLKHFWAEQGCLIWQPYYTQVGAGTMNPATRRALTRDGATRTAAGWGAPLIHRAGGSHVPRTAGLWRTILHRARADLPVVVAAGTLLLCATTLITAGVLYGDTVALGGLRRAVETAAPADQAVAVPASVPATDLATIDPLATATV